MYIDTSAQNVGIGTSSPLSLSGNATPGLTVSSNGPFILLQDANNADKVRYMSNNSGDLQFGIVGDDGATGKTEHMRIDESGKVGISNSSPSSYFSNASNLVVGGTTGANGMTISGSTDTQIFFADGTSGSDAYRGIIRYSHVDNGFSFWTDATEAMRIDASGRVTMPYQPAFQVAAASQDNIPIGTNTTVNFNNEVFDIGSNYSGTSFTAPVTGKYQLNVIIYAQNVDSAADYVQISLKTSNRQYYSIFSTNALDQDAAYMTFPVTMLADMDASDTAFVEVQLNATGSAQMDINANSYFSGYLVA